MGEDSPSQFLEFMEAEIQKASEGHTVKELNPIARGGEIDEADL